MKYSRAAAGTFLLPILFSSSIRAQAVRTFVSGTGDDANPCSRTAPCRTFASAISKTAAGGEIDGLDPNNFGAVTITKAITLDAAAGFGATIVTGSGATGVTVTAGANDVVTLRNLSVQGAGLGAIGVRLNQAKALHLENCVFANLTSHGIDLEPNMPVSVFIDNTTSRDNGGNGVLIQGSTPSALVAISNSHFENNALNGVLAGNNSKVTVRNGDASSNAGAGFLSQASTGAATLAIFDSLASLNTGPGFQAGGGSSTSTLRLTASSAFSNGSALNVGTNGLLYSYGNNYLTGGGAPTAVLSPQ